MATEFLPSPGSLGLGTNVWTPSSSPSTSAQTPVPLTSVYFAAKVEREAVHSTVGWSPHEFATAAMMQAAPSGARP